MTFNLKIYKGRPCKKCGSVERYVTSKRCVACKHNLSVNEWLRNKAVKQVLERHEITE